MTPDTPEAALWDGLCAALRHPPLIARSCKLRREGWTNRRLLMTFPRAALIRPHDPAPLLSLVGGTLPDAMADVWCRADVLHLGLDAEDDGIIRKLYLEFAPEAAPEPGLAYLALKCGGTRQGLHRYDRVTRADAVLDTLDLPPALRDAAGRLAALSQDLLHVTEAGSARLSLDIGLADLDPASRFWAPHVARLVTAINPAAPLPLALPSHVALGRDRHGAPFVTLYGWPEES